MKTNMNAIMKELELAMARGDMELAKLIKAQIKDMGDAGITKAYGRNKALIYVHA